MIYQGCVGMFYSVWKSYKTQSIQPRFPSEPGSGRLRWVILIIDFLRREWRKRKENISFVNRNKALSIHSRNNKMRLKICPLSSKLRHGTLSCDMRTCHNNWIQAWSGDLESQLCILFSVFCPIIANDKVLFVPKLHAPSPHKC